ncbi:MAG: PulJ/GspJ family protein [Phycisphaerae bacterium]
MKCATVPHPCHSHRRRAVTLLEVSLAMGLLVFLSSMTYWFYMSALETRKDETEYARKLRLARVTISTMAEELRQTMLIPNSGKIGIEGDPEAIWISTLEVPRKSMMPGGVTANGMPNPQTDLKRVEYRLARHPEVLDEDGFELSLGLIRNEFKLPRSDRPPDRVDGDGEFIPQETSGDTFDPDLDEFEDGGEPDVGNDINWQELYAPEIKYLRFCYFDGATWWDDWHVEGENPLPQLVRVTIGFKGEPPFGEEFGTPESLEYCTCMNEDPPDCEPELSDRLSVTVRIPTADPLFRSRIGRETQALMDETGDTDAEGDTGDAGRGAP